MLEPSFLSNAAELIYANSEYERLLLRARGYGAMFRVMIVYSVDFLYHTPGTGH